MSHQRAGPGADFAHAARGEKGDSADEHRHGPLMSQVAQLRALRESLALDPRVDNASAQLDILEREARALAGGTVGVVRLGSFPIASARLLASTLVRLEQDCPGIDILLDEAEPEELARRVMSGGLDLALVYEYDMLPTSWPPGMCKSALVHESLLLINSVRQPPLSPDLADCDELPWVSGREHSPGARCLELLCYQSGFTPRVTSRSNDYDVVRAVVGAGLGVAVIPALASIDDPALRATPLTLPRAGRTMFLIRREDDTNPTLEVVTRAFHQAVKGLSSELLRLA